MCAICIIEQQVFEAKELDRAEDMKLPARVAAAKVRPIGTAGAAA